MSEDQPQFSFASSFDHLKVYEDLERNGKWIKMGVANPDGTFPEALVVYCGKRNIQYQKAVEEALRPLQQEFKATNLGVADYEKLDKSVFTRRGVKNWRNVPDADGNQVPFSIAALEAWIEKYPKGYLILQEAAQNEDNYVPTRGGLEADAKK